MNLRPYQKQAVAAIIGDLALGEQLSSIMKIKYSLSDKHRSQLKPWADRWIKNAMSTKPMDTSDKNRAIEAVHGLYAAANLAPPKNIVFVPSPFVLRFATGFSAEIWRKQKSTYDATSAATYDATCAATHAATCAATHDATRAATRDATNDATCDATNDATCTATHDATCAATCAATHTATYAATNDATHDATRDATYDATHTATCAATHTATCAATLKQKTEKKSSAWYVASVDKMAEIDAHFGLSGTGLRGAVNAYDRFWQGGNQWSAYVAFLSFFRHVAKLELPIYDKWQHWETLAEVSGPRCVHEKFCMISDRPEVLLVDDQNRPHCDTGPFCRWRDGFALYAVHGVRVPWWIIENPEQITVQDIETEQNAEIRRVMVDKYGQSKFLVDSGAKEIHRDDYGVLYRKEIPNDESLVMVKVVNSTPEPDGTFKDYFIRVDPKCVTARGAIAWSFGISETEYAPAVET